MKVPNASPPTPPNPDGVPKPTGPATGATQAAEVSTATSARAQLEQLKIANRETVLARVADIVSQQSSGASRLLLDIRGQNLTVDASIGKTPLQTGDWVKVMRAGNELQLMGKLAPTAESSVARALAQRLPWQQSLDGGLARVLASLAGASQPLPPGVRQAIDQLASLLPSRQSLAGTASSDARPSQSPLTPLGTPQVSFTKATDSATTNQVRQWLEQSGLFAESRTARSAEAPPADLKLAIGRIIDRLLQQQGQTLNSFNRLTPIPTPELIQSPLQFPNPAAAQAPQFSAEPTGVGQMLRLLAGVLNRITVNQLHSQVLSTRTAADAPAPNNTLVVDLPWLNQNNEPRVMQLRLEEKTGENESDRQGRGQKTEWRLSLAMNLDDAGPLHFDVALGFGQVSAQVWAERQATLQQATDLLPELRKSLTDLGLEVVDLECRRGIPKGATTQLEHRLVDTRA
jgi:Flagellar hook-length control protein FliK